ncbi:probable cytochrome P450 6a13 isoform X2 [Leptinotarsa decemlineata]|uniref:probable cytochrome P450 6a13 isoform X2 n=1 Tax=Leptinotarsa decemlineata TaxID=7539 RepID=UPI003D307E99
MWILVPILITISASFYLYSKWKFSYWRRKGFAYIEPEFIFGNTKQFFRNQVSYGALFDEFYRKFKSMGLKYGGVYNFFKPILIVTDLNLIKDLLQKDFEYFPNRGFYVDEENDPLAGNLFCLEDEKWKALRVKLNPTFSSAGSETSATTISSALLELAVNHDIQEKARHEIREVLKKHNGEVTYEALGDMTYLDLIMMETLRKHSPAAKLLRKCGKPYTIPGSNCVIEAGTSLIIPVYSIQRDPDIYPDPEQFDPERFTSENKSKRHPCSFLSFGDGPRYCIGIRMGKLQIKIGLAEILKNFKVFLNERTSYPIEYESTLVSSVPKGGIWLNLEKVEKY